MNPNVLAWLRKLIASGFGGAADGTIAAFTGGGAATIIDKIQVSPETVLLIIAANTVVDVARFVKANSDPWSFPTATVPPVLPQ